MELVGVAVALASAAIATVALLLVARRRASERALAGLRLPPGELEGLIGGLHYLREGFMNICHFEGDGPRKMRFLAKSTVLVRNLEQIKSLLSGDCDTVTVSWPTATGIMLGKHSVTMSTGAYHKALRRLLGPCFAPSGVESYLPAIQAICERYCSSWVAATQAAGEAATAAGADKAPAALPRMQSEARLLTFEVMARVVAGFHFSQQELLRLSDAFDTLVRGIFFPVALPIPGTPFSKAVAARKVIVRALDEQLDAFAAAPAAAAAAASAPRDGSNGNGNGSVRKGSSSGEGDAGAADGGGCGPGGSVMERLLGMRDEEGKPLSRVALQDLAINLLFAGHETTATSIIRLLLRLRSEPAVVARLREEQRAAVATHGTAVTSAALRDMPYLDAVVKEMWRIDFVVPMVPRKAARTFQLGGYDVPQDWRVVLGLVEPIRDVPAWRDAPTGDRLHASVFNPDRWHIASPGAGGEGPGQLSSPSGMLPAQMLTFGGGTRYCLGVNLAWAEVKVFLCVLLRGYEFAPALDELQVRTFPAVSVTDGFPVKVRPLAQPIAGAA